MPKVFPLHLRGTGGSFATNVGGRMIGTGAAFLTANSSRPCFPAALTIKWRSAAGWVSLGIVAVASSSVASSPSPKARWSIDSAPCSQVADPLTRD
jgi:hypothetical protein